MCLEKVGAMISIFLNSLKYFLWLNMIYSGEHSCRKMFILLVSDGMFCMCLNPFYLMCLSRPMSFPGSSAGKTICLHAGEPSSMPGLGRSTGEGIGYLLQYSCLENSMDMGDWQATVHGVAESDTTEWLSQDQCFLITFLSGRSIYWRKWGVKVSYWVLFYTLALGLVSP